MAVVVGGVEGGVGGDAMADGRVRRHPRGLVAVAGGQEDGLAIGGVDMEPLRCGTWPRG
ncbi:MAG: hypothetical protein R3F60_32300 [bacterium]